MTEPALRASPLAAFGESRLWVTMLWSLVFAFVAAGWDWAESELLSRAAALSIVMLPREPLDELARRDAEARFRDDPAVAQLRWLNAEELNKQLGSRFSDPAWRERLAAESAWLPSVLSIRPANPLDHFSEIQAFLARRAEEGQWQVLWDGPRASVLRESRDALRLIGGALLCAVFLFGGLALWRAPWPTAAGRWFFFWSALLSLAVPAGFLFLVSRTGLYYDPRTVTIAIGAAFVLAVLLAPLLHRRAPAPVAPVLLAPPPPAAPVAPPPPHDPRPEPKPSRLRPEQQPSSLLSAMEKAGPTLTAPSRPVASPRQAQDAYRSAATHPSRGSVFPRGSVDSDDFAERGEASPTHEDKP